jgi:hypothetical protein
MMAFALALLTTVKHEVSLSLRLRFQPLFSLLRRTLVP